MDQQLREMLGKAIYEQEKTDPMNRNLRGDILEWERLKPFQKEVWCKRAEVAVSAFIDQLTPEVQKVLVETYVNIIETRLEETK